MPQELLLWKGPCQPREFLSLDLACTLQVAGRQARLREMSVHGPRDFKLAESSRAQHEIAAQKPFAIGLGASDSLKIMVDAQPKEAIWHYYCENCHFELGQYCLDSLDLETSWHEASRRFWREAQLHACPRCRAQASPSVSKSGNPE